MGMLRGVLVLIFLLPALAYGQGYATLAFRAGAIAQSGGEAAPQPIGRFDCEDLTGGTLVNQVGDDDLQQTGAGTFAQVASHTGLGNACSCSGASSYVAANSGVFNFTDSYSVLAAYNVDVTTTSEIMFGKSSSVTTTSLIQYQLWWAHIGDTNKLLRGSLSTGSVKTETPTHQVQTFDGVWAGYAIVFDNANDSLKTYVNQDFTFTTTTNVPASSSEIFEVCEQNGDFDELEIFDFALTHEQVVAWMIARGF